MHENSGIPSMVEKTRATLLGQARENVTRWPLPGANVLLEGRPPRRPRTASTIKMRGRHHVEFRTKPDDTEVVPPSETALGVVPAPYSAVLLLSLRAAASALPKLSCAFLSSNSPS